MFSNSPSKMSESQIKFWTTSFIWHLRWKWHEIESFSQKNEAKVTRSEVKVTLCPQKWGESDTIWGESDTIWGETDILPSKMRRKWHSLRRLEAKLKFLDLPDFPKMGKMGNNSSDRLGRRTQKENYVRFMF